MDRVAIRHKVNWLFFLNNRGEAGSSGDGDKGGDKGGQGGSAGPDAGGSISGDGKTFIQADVDRIVQDRLSRERQKYSDYEDLRNKVIEYEKHKEQINQKDLENKQEYEKLKEGWTKKEQELNQKLTDANRQVQNERIDNALTNEVMKQNAYPEASQLLKSLTKYNEDGTITIKGKDANGVDSDLPVEQGVEQFLKARPHLVKGSGQGGAGTSGGHAEGGQGGGGNDENLGQQLQDAMAVGDRKKINDLKIKIREKHSKSGVQYIV